MSACINAVFTKKQCPYGPAWSNPIAKVIITFRIHVGYRMVAVVIF